MIKTNPLKIASNFDAPRNEDEPVFSTPWEARVFAMTAHMAEMKHFEWDDFRDNLVSEISRDDLNLDCNLEEGTPYYRSWMAAIEQLLVQSQVCSGQELEDRINQLRHPLAAGKKSATGSLIAPVSEILTVDEGR